MKKKVLNFPCKCGHGKRVHGYAGPPIGEGWCDGKGMPKDVGWKNACQCYEYVSDNLKYLEQMAKKKRGNLK